jgi:hypothetical protein
VRCLVGIFASLFLMAMLPSAVSAYEDQATLGLTVGWAGMPRPDLLPGNGVDVGLVAGGGLGDSWSIQGLLSYNVFLDERPLHLGMAGLETVYALDIVRFVPLIGFGLDGLLSVRDRSTRGDFALHALLGVDYLINPRWLVGADARGYWVATHASSPLPSFIVTAGVRVGVRFDLH